MTTLNDALVTIIQKTQGAVETGVSFLSAQIPDVIQQLLMWKLTAALVYTLFGIALIVLSIVLMFKALKKPAPIDPNAHSRNNYKLSWCYDEDGDTHPGIILTPLVLSGVLLVGVSATSNVMTALQIYIAPKVWLIEYAASLAK